MKTHVTDVVAASVAVGRSANAAVRAWNVVRFAHGGGRRCCNVALTEKYERRFV